MTASKINPSKTNPRLSEARRKAGRRGGLASAARRGSADYLVGRVVELAPTLTAEQRRRLHAALAEPVEVPAGRSA